jgi:dynein heavy chain
MISLAHPFQTAKRKKESLAAEVNSCTQKLDRATQLIDGLGGEKARWTVIASEAAAKRLKITGDVLLSVGCPIKSKSNHIESEYGSNSN